MASEQEELDAFNADTARLDQFLALAKKYTDFSELTTPMILEFVDKIIVHAPERIDGERTQEIEIYLKYIGKLDIPVRSRHRRK
jgi:carbonic anhydrase